MTIERACVYCAAPFVPAKPWQDFCMPVHRKAYNNRRATEGSTIRDLALYWRSSRDKEALSALCHFVDAILNEDRAQGKPKPKRPRLIMAKHMTALGTDRMPRQPYIPKG